MHKIIHLWKDKNLFGLLLVQKLTINHLYNQWQKSEIMHSYKYTQRERVECFIAIFVVVVDIVANFC